MKVISLYDLPQDVHSVTDIAKTFTDQSKSGGILAGYTLSAVRAHTSESSHFDAKSSRGGHQMHTVT